MVEENESLGYSQHQTSHQVAILKVKFYVPVIKHLAIDKQWK